jgi:hypothetical protein
MEGLRQMDATDYDIARVEALVARIKPIMAHQQREIQGAVLAELLSIWLAGHYQGGPECIEAMLNLHVDMVRKLIPLNINLLKAGRDEG